MRTLELKQGVIYGPVRSRRLGPSLGINLLPWTYKLCTFDCLYCHFGWTKVHARDAQACRSDLPAVDQVRKALESWFGENRAPIEYLTFSGNGEPCLHPQFDQMVEVARQARDRFAPRAKVALLSNSTCLEAPQVRSGLERVEVKIMKLDCGNQAGFRRINRPCAGVEFDRVVENLKELDDFILQSILVDGSASNTSPQALEAWIKRLVYIRPREVQIYSIDRPSADRGLALVGKDSLRRIAQMAQEACGIPVKVF
jgi:wyosine [tRNA(Phe)-imidazoG37] synthetase (radical SAM superfamily)